MLAAVALAACAPAAAPPLSASSDAISASAIDPGNAGGNKVTTVVSRNLYLGADLLPVIAASTEEEFLAATTAAWAMAQRNDFSVRVQGIADEIAAARPEVVGLQEAYTWRFRTAAQSPAEAVVVDYVQLLVDALADRGLQYHAAATVTLFELDDVPVLTAEGLAFVGATDHGVILAREDVTAVNPEAHVFSTLLPVEVLGTPLQIPRGWVSVDVKDQGEWYRFVSVHLEAYHPVVQVAQAQELAAALAQVPGRVVLVGDLNSVPGMGGAAVLAASGLTDLWPVVSPGDPGFTSPYDEDLTIAEIELDERIDYVMFRGEIVPLEAEVVGEELTDRVGGLWPSDHAGVVATLRLVEPRFFALR
jgi:endonuclease/exonuclease/phosphatase family metal-dependent hydrolase